MQSVLQDFVPSAIPAEEKRSTATGEQVEAVFET